MSSTTTLRNRPNIMTDLADENNPKRYEVVTLNVTGMDCADCATIIEHTLTHREGVLTAEVGYASGRLRVKFDQDKMNTHQIIKQLKRFGYSASLTVPKSTWWQRYGELVLSLSAGMTLLTGWLLSNTTPLLSQACYIATYLLAGALSFRDSVQTLLQKRVDIEMLMVFAAIGAAILGEWAEGGLLLFLFSLGHALEHKAMHHAKDEVQALSKLAPDTAIVVRGDNELELHVNDINLDDMVIVKAGQRIALDGDVLTGVSAVNQAPITGESIPVDKSPGDEVFAGSINGSGLLKIKPTRLASNSTLQRMVKLVLEADTQKSPSQHFTDKFVKVFVPAILLGVLLLIFIPPLFGQTWTQAFYRAMAVLVAASPCALAIATPAAVLSGVARAAGRGILIKGGMHLENLGSVRAIAFDKTGTLTLGQPQVQDIITLKGDEKTLLQIAASVEVMSSHPLGQAIVNHANVKKVSLLSVSDVNTIAGQGIKAIVNDKVVKIGNATLFSPLPIAVKDAADALLKMGQTIMIVQYDDVFLGVIGLADQIRPETAPALKKLIQQGIEHTIMLTGDHQVVAENVAKAINITDCLANLLPEDKLDAIAELERRYHHIAMVGDGINDAPALARATVGIAMGGAGSDVALEAADVALMADDLSQLPFAIRLSRQALRTIKINLFISLGMVFVLLILTVTDLSGIGPAIIAHEGSTLIVVLNALRLLYFR